MRATDPDFLHYLKTGNMNLTENLGIPTVKGIKFKDIHKADLLGFNYCTNPKTMKERENAFVHFFLPDHYIERVWNNPDYYLGVFSQYKGIVQPDFSVYTDMPKVMQMWNHYRRNWLTQWYQQQGIRVIPAPTWGDEDSFEWCFEGMPKGSCLCVSTVGCVQNLNNRLIFNAGFTEMLKQLEPSQLILYGAITDAIREQIYGIPYKHIDSEQKQRMEKYSQRQK